MCSTYTTRGQSKHFPEKNEGVTFFNFLAYANMQIFVIISLWVFLNILFEFIAEQKIMHEFTARYADQNQNKLIIIV